MGAPTEPFTPRKLLDMRVEFEPMDAAVLDCTLNVRTKFLFALVFEGEGNTVSVDCTYESRYRLNDDYKPSDAEIDAFRLGNAVFNCWGFFREFSQNSMLRMGYPPISIPFLRLSLTPKTELAATEPTPAPVKKRKKKSK